MILCENNSVVLCYVNKHKSSVRYNDKLKGIGHIMKSHIFISLILLSFIFLPGCSPQSDVGNMPDVLKIGLLPDQDKASMEKRYRPLLSYLSKQLGVSYQIKSADSYAGLVKQFTNKEIDLAYFGGFAFIQALDKANAIPLVMRDIDVNFTSYFIIKTNSTTGNEVKHIKDFKGRRLVFGSRLSTSGHLMPRFFLQNRNIDINSFFSSTEYSGAHDKTAYWVRDSKADIGAANSIIIDKMFADGRLKKSDVQILWQSPPYPDYVWAVQADFSETVRNKISDAFLSLSPSNKEHEVILSSLDAGGFLPASVNDFTQLHEIAHQTGLLERNPEHAK